MSNLYTIITDPNHRTGGGRFPDRLSNPVDQISLFAFLETLDAKTVPFVTLYARASGNEVIVSFDSVSGVPYSLEGRAALTGATFILTNVTGTGARLEVPLPNNPAPRFVRLLAP